MKRALILSLLPFASACYTINYVYEPSSGLPSTHDEWHHRMLWGIVEFDKPVNLSALCPNGFTQVRTEVSFINGLADWGVTTLVSSVSAGALYGVDLYSPSTISVWCDDGSAFLGVLREDGLVEEVVRKVPPGAEL